MLHVAFDVPASSLCWGAVTHPDVVTGHESRLGHAKVASCMSLQPDNVSVVTYIHVLLSPPPPTLSLNMKCVL